jgi:hypothetical protein
MEKRNELRVMLLECFWLRLPDLQPQIVYTTKNIFSPFWENLDEFEQRNAGTVFKEIVRSVKHFPMRLLDEKTSGNSLQYMLN